MAKKKATRRNDQRSPATPEAGRGAKTAMVRDLIGEGKGNSEIVAIMQERGLSIHPTYVSAIRSKTSGKRRKKRGKQSRQPVGAATKESRKGSVESVRMAVEFCKSVGGIGEAEKLLDSLKDARTL